MRYTYLFLLLLSMNSEAAALKYDVSEFATVENLNSVDLDESAQIKIGWILPRLYRRFCHLRVRPDAVAVSVGLVQVEWSIDRICNQSFPKEEVLESEEESTLAIQPLSGLHRR